MGAMYKLRIITMQYKYALECSIRPKELFDELSKRGWEVHYIYVHKNIELDSFGHKVRKIPIYPRSLPYLIQTFFVMMWLNKKMKIDAIITWSLLEAFVSVLFKSFSKNTKAIIFIRGDAISVAEYSIKNDVKRALYIHILKVIERFVLKRADRVVFLSNENRKRIMERAKFNDINRTKVVYNNINTPRIEKLSKERAVNFGVNKKVIGFVGGISEEVKGLKYLIRAFYKVKQKIPNSLLVLVGDGPDKQKLISLAKSLNLENDVIFTGFKENPLQYMKGFDLMVLPSTSEAFGYVLLEAMYVGTPVIGSNVGGIPEVLKYDELLFEPRNIDKLVSKILNLLQSEEAYKKALKLCEERKRAFIFDWGDEVTKAIEEVIR